MTTPYIFRLECLCFACFFIVHTALGVTACLCSFQLSRKAQRISPRAAERLFFALRTIPTAAALLFLLLLCIPSYLRLEPAFAAEQIGYVCSAAAILGVAIWIESLIRTLLTIARSRHHTRAWKTIDRSDLRNAAGEICVLETEAPLLALKGLLKPTVVISRSVLRTLTEEQLQSALRHEAAHRRSFDNWKRLLIVLLPQILPFSRSFGQVDSAWIRFAEWAADDEATRGSRDPSLSLAEALLNIARIRVESQTPFLLAPLLTADDELRARCERLLEPNCEAAKSRLAISAFSGALVMALGGSCLFIAFRPEALGFAHRLLERLIL